MHFKRLYIENFRGYKSLELNFDPSFNLIIGDNGSGKTALLEALTVAMGSFFLGIKNVYSRGIYKKDIHIATYEDNEEYTFPVKIAAEGEIQHENIEWGRELNGFKNRTTTTNSKKLMTKASDIDRKVRKGEKVELPLLIYYATGRLFDEARNKDYSSGKTLASRFRAYDRCLEAKSTHKQFQKWFRGKELSRIQKGVSDISYDIVKSVIIKNLPNCKNIYFEFDPDKSQGLKIELKDGRILPFGVLRREGTGIYYLPK